MKNITISVKPTGAPKDKAATLLLQGELVLSHMDELVGQVRQAMARYDLLVIELNQVDNLDLSFIQLLHAVRKTALMTSKTCRVEATLSEQLETVLERTGLGLQSLLSNPTTNQQ